MLIDADMRNPSLHHAFQRSLGLGLSNLLTGNGHLVDYIQESGTPNLSIIMAGQIPPNPAELLSDDAIVRVIHEASKRFDHVIVDGPPVLGLADSPLLSRAVEATVIVIEAGRTPASRARHAVDRLFGVRTHIIGAILTKFDLKTTGYGYGYGYEYRYGTADDGRFAVTHKLGKFLPRARRQ